MPIATNDKGEALRLDEGGKWVPTKMATNPQTGEKLVLDGDQWMPIPKEKPNSLVDAARSLPGGLVKGITGLAGLPGTLSDLASSGLDYVANKVTGADIHTDKSPLSGAALANVASKPTGGFYEPQTTAGHYAETAAEFAPAAFGGQASLAQRALGRVLAPAVTSETAGQVAGGTPYESAARLGGALLGGSPSVVTAGTRAVGNALTSRLAESLPAEDAALVSKYEAMGGHLRPGQYSPSNFMRHGDSVISDTPWPRAAGFAKDSAHAAPPVQQSAEFNQMLAKTFGADAPRITDDVIQQARTRIGKVYEEVLPRNSIAASPQLNDALAGVEEKLKLAAPAMDSADANRIQNVLEGIRTQLADGSIPGTLYQKYRQRGGLLDEMAGSKSPVVQDAGTSIRRALDDAFVEQANELDGPALKQARAHYRNLETIAPLAAKAPTGNISPGLVLGVVNKEFGSPANAGDLGTLARVGAAYLKAQPSSGTAERTIWRSLVNKPFSEGIPAVGNAAMSLPVSALASRSLNKIINSPEMRAKLLGQTLQKNGAVSQTPNSAAQLGALLTKGKP